MGTQRTQRGIQLYYNASVLLAALLVAACGGAGGGAPSSCTLGGSSGCGGSVQPTLAPIDTPPDPAAKAASISLVVSSAELASAGLPGSDVTVTALVKTADNTAVTDAKIEFSADSGFLAVASPATTDKTGKASAALGTGGSRLNRTITVTAKAGSQRASAVIKVVGTRLSISGPAVMTTGSTSELVATLVDSAGRPIAGEAVTVSAANGNSVSASAKVSDANGQMPVRIDATRRGSEQVTVGALGASASRTITIGGSDVSVTPAIVVDAGGGELLQEVAVGACAPVDGQYVAGGAAQSGSVTLNASRGTLYRDVACSQALAGALSLVNGDFPRTYIRSGNAGVTMIEASIAGGPRGSTRLEFVASLLPTARVNLQTDVAVVGSGARSELVAVVRDGSAANNLVKGATVQFSILSDPSGGVLLSPFTSVTGSDGVARGAFVAGPADGGKNGTVIQARIAELPGSTATTSLTVNRKALSIQFGTGNSLIPFSSAVLQQDFAVFVSDSAGNPVRDVSISAAAWPTEYGKGSLKWEPDNGPAKTPGAWIYNDKFTVCVNEDSARKGLYESADDRNANGILEPGIPLSVSSSGKTDALGLATVSLRYPRDRARWVRVELTVTGNVAGTESLAHNTFWLTGIAADYTDLKVAPPGEHSPYGSSDSCFNPY